MIFWELSLSLFPADLCSVSCWPRPVDHNHTLILRPHSHHQQPSLTRSTNWIKDWSSSLWTQTRKSVGQSLIERKSLPAAARECRREEAGRSWNWPEMHLLTKNVHILFKHLQGLTKCTGLSRSENLPVELKSDLHHSWAVHQWTGGQPSKNSMSWYKESNRSPTVSTKPSSPCWEAKD